MLHAKNQGRGGYDLANSHRAGGGERNTAKLELRAAGAAADAAVTVDPCDCTGQGCELRQIGVQQNQYTVI